jgi:hypothetical protein
MTLSIGFLVAWLVSSNDRGTVPVRVWKDVQTTSLSTMASSIVPEQLRAILYQKRMSDHDVTTLQVATILNEHEESLAHYLEASNARNS